MTTFIPSVQVDREKIAFSGYGEIFSFTTLQDPPKDFEEQAPYLLAFVKLDEGPIVLAQLTDVGDSVQIGDRVEMVTRKLTTEGVKGMIVYGYKFRPVINHENS